MADQSKYISKLHDQRVLIIGGSSGIGYAVAEAVIEHGGFVIISSSSLQRVDTSVESLQRSYPSSKDRISGYAANMAEEATIETNVVNLLDQCGKLDHIVYTAGDPVPPSPIAEATLEKIKSAATVRYTAPIFLAKHAPKYLNASSDSSITLTTGVVAERPMQNFSLIAGPRAAVPALGRNLALDLKPIRVNVVSVGAVNTNTWSHLAPEEKERLFNSLVSKSTTGRIAEASDVAEAYLYCLKDKNVSGSVVSSNGGSLLV